MGSQRDKLTPTTPPHPKKAQTEPHAVLLTTGPPSVPFPPLNPCSSSAKITKHCNTSEIVVKSPLFTYQRLISPFDSSHSLSEAHHVPVTTVILKSYFMPLWCCNYVDPLCRASPPLNTTFRLLQFERELVRRSFQFLCCTLWCSDTHERSQEHDLEVVTVYSSLSFYELHKKLEEIDVKNTESRCGNCICCLRARNALAVTQKACLLIECGNRLKAENQRKVMVDGVNGENRRVDK